MLDAAMVLLAEEPLVPALDVDPCELEAVDDPCDEVPGEGLVEAWLLDATEDPCKLDAEEGPVVVP